MSLSSLLRRENGQGSRILGEDGSTQLASYQLVPRLEVCARLPHSGVSVVHSLTYSPDGSVLASSADDCKVRLWNTSKSPTKCTQIDTGHTLPVYLARFMPDGTSSKLVTCSGDRQVRVICLERLAIRPYNIHRSRVKALAAVDPYVFLSCSDDGCVRRCDVRERAPGPNNNNADGPSNTIGGTTPAMDPSLIVEQRSELPGRSNLRISINAMALDPLHSHLFATGGADALVRLYDLRMLPAASRVTPGIPTTAAWWGCCIPSHLRTALNPLSPGLFASAASYGRMRQVAGLAWSDCGTTLVASYTGEHIYTFCMHNNVSYYGTFMASMDGPQGQDRGAQGNDPWVRSQAGDANPAVLPGFEGLRHINVGAALRNMGQQARLGAEQHAAEVGQGAQHPQHQPHPAAGASGVGRQVPAPPVQGAAPMGPSLQVPAAGGSGDEPSGGGALSGPGTSQAPDVVQQMPEACREGEMHAQFSGVQKGAGGVLHAAERVSGSDTHSVFTLPLPGSPLRWRGQALQHPNQTEQPTVQPGGGHAVQPHGGPVMRISMGVERMERPHQEPPHDLRPSESQAAASGPTLAASTAGAAAAPASVALLGSPSGTRAWVRLGYNPYASAASNTAAAAAPTAVQEPARSDSRSALPTGQGQVQGLRASGLGPGNEPRLVLRRLLHMYSQSQPAMQPSLQALSGLPAARAGVYQAPSDQQQQQATQVQSQQGLQRTQPAHLQGELQGQMPQRGRVRVRLQQVSGPVPQTSSVLGQGADVRSRAAIAFRMVSLPTDGAHSTALPCSLPAALPVPNAGGHTWRQGQSAREATAGSLSAPDTGRRLMDAGSADEHAGDRHAGSRRKREEQPHAQHERVHAGGAGSIHFQGKDSLRDIEGSDQNSGAERAGSNGDGSDNDGGREGERPASKCPRTGTLPTAPHQRPGVAPERQHGTGPLQRSEAGPGSVRNLLWPQQRHVQGEPAMRSRQPPLRPPALSVHGGASGPAAHVGGGASAAAADGGMPASADVSAPSGWQRLLHAAHALDSLADRQTLGYASGRLDEDSSAHLPYSPPRRAMGALGSPAHIPAMQHNLSALSITPAEGDTSFSRCFRGHKNSMVLKDVAIMGSIGPQRHHQLHAAGRGYVLCGSDDGTTCVWDACNGMLVRMLPALEPEAGITTCIGVHPHMPMLASGGTAPIVRVWAPCGDPASSREVEETQRADNKDAHLEWHATHGPHLSSSQRALAMANVHDIEAQAGGRRAGDAGPASPAHWAGSAVAARLFSELAGVHPGGQGSRGHPSMTTARAAAAPQHTAGPRSALGVRQRQPGAGAHWADGNEGSAQLLGPAEAGSAAGASIGSDSELRQDTTVSSADESMRHGEASGGSSGSGGDSEDGSGSPPRALQLPAFGSSPPAGQGPRQTHGSSPGHRG